MKRSSPGPQGKTFLFTSYRFARKNRRFHHRIGLVTSVFRCYNGIGKQYNTSISLKFFCMPTLFVTRPAVWSNMFRCLTILIFLSRRNVYCFVFLWTVSQGGQLFGERHYRKAPGRSQRCICRHYQRTHFQRGAEDPARGSGEPAGQVPI